MEKAKPRQISNTLSDSYGHFRPDFPPIDLDGPNLSDTKLGDSARQGGPLLLPGARGWRKKGDLRFEVQETAGREDWDSRFKTQGNSKRRNHPGNGKWRLRMVEGDRAGSQGRVFSVRLACPGGLANREAGGGEAMPWGCPRSASACWSQSRGRAGGTPALPGFWGGLPGEISGRSTNVT